jgi:Calcineurin-like phosphoesterase
MSSFARNLLFATICLEWGCGKAATSSGRDWVASPAVFTAAGTDEIDAVGDLHGDVLVTSRVLSAAGLITASTPFHWIGGTRILIVTGDVIDKGTAALPIIDLFIKIEPEARAAGGHVVVTLGNHEAEFLADPTGPKSADFQAELTNRRLDPKQVAAGDSPYGAWLLARPVAALIGGWFFCHAGHSNGLSATAMADTFRKIFDTVEPAGGKTRFDDPFLVGANSLLEAQLWWRGNGATTSVATIDADLTALPAAHAVFGHDPGAIDFGDDPHGSRSRGEMVTRYDGRLFLIDVGMSSAVGYSAGALLRIVRGNAEQTSAVFSDGTSQILWP